MKFLLAGAYRWPWYEEACARALGELGHEVVRFAWDDYFRGWTGRIQRRLLQGPAVSSLNEDLARATMAAAPDVLLVWRGVPIRSSTLRQLRRTTGPLLISRNNDDPFSQKARWTTWRVFLSAIPEYDLHLAYRPHNIEDYQAAGAQCVRLMLPFFVPELHHPVELSARELERFGCEAVFVGHYEPDGRVDMLRSLVEDGVDVKLWGGESWSRKALGDLWGKLGPVEAAYGEDYTRALAGAKICLSFLSAMNRDTYTRRCFEIPACGQPLVSQDTDDLRRLFLEGDEAAFFETRNELVETVKSLLDDSAQREKMARAGRRRVVKDGHDVLNRMAGLVEICREMTA